MNLLNPGVNKVIFYNGTDVFTLSGNDISPESTLTRRSQTRNGSRGGYLPFLVEHTLEINLSDASFYDSLTSDKYNIFIEKSNGYYVWGESVSVIKDEDVLFDPSSEEYPYLVKCKNVMESPQIGQDGNLLGSFVDLDGDGQADGWSFAAAQDPLSFSQGQQTIERSIRYDLGFAYPGADYTLEVNFINLHDDADNELILRFIDGSTTLLTEDKVITSTGVDSVTATAPAGTDKIEAQVRATNINTDDDITIENPKLTIA